MRKVGRPIARPVDKRTIKLARGHVMRPKHVVQASAEKGLRPRRRRITRLGRFKHKPLTLKPQLKVGEFGPALHAKLAGSVTGYAWQLRKGGKPIHSGHWEWSQTPSNAGHGWSLDTRMHVASVSKLLTAMAILHVLNARNKTVNAPIRDYLPDYWTRGSKVNDITFRHLLNHTSGLRGGDSDFGAMKSNIAAGVASTFGQGSYSNLNFSLCRILLPVLWGWIDPSDTHGNATDHIWDVRTILRFQEYCQTHVFNPAGVSGVSFKSAAGGALAYKYPHGSTKGWDSADLSTASGAVAFHLSVNELLAVMGTFRRGGTIVTPAQAQTFLDSMLGIDQVITTAAGKLYNKNGRWTHGDGRTEQAVAYFMPNDMELAVFVNSQIGDSKSLRKLVADTYIASL